mmetsp:Transcript_33342/g.76036  ORF Transcript_33342/g.76036 Transcript_33342/m.76036 type:complete len:239 (-) Transcript_33342:439-1155(-)
MKFMLKIWKSEHARSQSAGDKDLNSGISNTSCGLRTGPSPASRLRLPTPLHMESISSWPPIGILKNCSQSDFISDGANELAPFMLSKGSSSNMTLPRLKPTAAQIARCPLFLSQGTTRIGSIRDSPDPSSNTSDDLKSTGFSDPSTFTSQSRAMSGRTVHLHMVALKAPSWPNCPSKAGFSCTALTDISTFLNRPFSTESSSFTRKLEGLMARVLELSGALWNWSGKLLRTTFTASDL